VAHNAKWLPWVAGQIEGLGLTVAPSAGNFVLIRFRDAGEAALADSALTAAGFVLRGMGGYGLPDSLRLSIGDEEANVGVVAALKRFLA
jgi:histidinol-phosphate aminotransferase